MYNSNNNKDAWKIDDGVVAVVVLGPNHNNNKQNKQKHLKTKTLITKHRLQLQQHTSAAGRFSLRNIRRQRGCNRFASARTLLANAFAFVNNVAVDRAIHAIQGLMGEIGSLIGVVCVCTRVSFANARDK